MSGRTPLTAEDDCTHSDERGSTVMQVTDDRYECIVCGERFRLVSAAKFDPFIDGARGRVDGTFAARSRPAAGLDGRTIEVAIAAASPLVNPHLSEVDWDAVAARLIEDPSPLGHGTPVPEEATLPSGDARVAGL